MNPDGTGQMEHYGSNSYWPASMFLARPVPNHPTRFVAVVGGHHDQPRMGDLVLFDPCAGPLTKRTGPCSDPGTRAKSRARDVGSADCADLAQVPAPLAL